MFCIIFFSIIFNFTVFFMVIVFPRLARFYNFNFLLLLDISMEKFILEKNSLFVFFLFFTHYLM